MKLCDILLKTFWLVLAIVCPLTIGWVLIDTNGYTGKAYEIGLAVGGLIAIASFCVISSMLFKSE